MIFLIIGVPLLILGAFLVISGFSSLGLSGFKESKNSMFSFAIGAFLILIGFFLVGLTIIKPMSKYTATEASSGVKTIGQSFGDGLEKSRFDSSEKKEIIKIKCPHCGYLESEDAKFCSKCSKKI